MENKIDVSEHIRGIAFVVIMSIVTCGLYNIYLQYIQIKTLNVMVKEEKYSFIKWFLLSIITCGLYHVYHEYVMAQDLVELTSADSNFPLIALVCSLFGFSIIIDAIHQKHINEYFGHNEV
jgi:hypothetical protein